MSDYDLVIVGGTQIARQGAIAAAQEGARVALVEPKPEGIRHRLNHQALITLTQQAHQWQTSPMAQVMGAGMGAGPSMGAGMISGMGLAPLLTSSPSLGERWNERWNEMLIWIETLGQAAIAPYAPDQLALAGVDLIQASAQFHPQPRLHLTTAQRNLTARAYLLLTEFTYQAPAGITLAPDHHRPDQIWTWPRLPQRIAILGNTPTALELAQAFATLGTIVVLWLPPEGAIANGDSSTANWIIAQLQSNGIDIRGGSPPQITVAPTSTADTNADGPSHIPSLILQFADEAIPVDRLIVAMAPRLKLDGLGLETLGLIAQRGTIQVNEQLQTLYPNLFVGGTALGAQGIDAIAPQEVTIALKNALLLPRFRLNPRALPWRIQLSPEIAGVGISASQAQAWYGQDAWTLHTPLYANPQAQLQGNTIGFCQLIVHRQGKILGATLAAPQASDLLQPVVQAIEQDLPIAAIAQTPQLSQGLAAIVQATADQWRQRKRQPGQWRRDWQENWFNWRRQD